MPAVADFVLETSNSPGTGAFSLLGTVTGRRTWVSAFTTGTQVYYVATDGNQWEEGYGTVTSGSPNTLSRDAVIENSLGSTARINFTATVQVYCPGANPGRRQVLVTADNAAVDAGNRRIINANQGTSNTDLLRLDQVGLLAINAYSTNGALVVVPLPVSNDVIRIDLRSMMPQASAAMYLRVSVDGGNSFLQGSSEYRSCLLYTSGSGATTYAATGTFLQLSQGLPVSSAGGYVEIDMQTRTIAGRINSYDNINMSSGSWSTSSAPTHVAIGFINTGLTTGRAKVSRRIF